ncbi:monofunctional biosynthetic peptidoglycan transglycosylase [Bacteroidia bacterium]|nr:monofunctional biosynthetic peptidoglycan transglycosylase [Bacteroidia bacterium]
MKKWVKKIVHWARNGFFCLFILSLLTVILFKFVPVYYTGYMFAKNTGQLFSGKKVEIHHKWVSLAEISPDLVQAAMASEDYLFLIHNGFDFNEENLQLSRGARALHANKGTISQETARNVFLLPGENYLNETLEMYFTLLIEFVWGKKRIMEVYLNSVEMGDAVFGAEAIAEKDFDKPASELTVPEAALIAAALVHSEEWDLRQPNTYLLRRQAKIRGLMEDRIQIEW